MKLQSQNRPMGLEDENAPWEDAPRIPYETLALNSSGTAAPPELKANK
jgi:hypothetical protein